MKCQRCPHCGFNQEQPSAECPRCGIVFAKYHARHSVDLGGPPAPPQNDPEPRTEWFRPALRLFRWFSIIVTVMVLYLILNPSPSPVVQFDQAARQSAERKLAQLERSVRAGRDREIELSEPELNAWLKSNLEFGPAPPAQGDAASRAGLPAVPGQEGRLDSSEEAEIQSTITDLKVVLVGEQIRTYLRFQLYGKEMSFELQGRLSSREGYLYLEPTAGRLGSFPIPSVSLSAAANRLFESPTNREKFRLPEYISRVAVEGGKLLVQCAKQGQQREGFIP